eukprot:scaffold4623_cov142-Skeletonema_menzelii.AAC.5
MQPGTEASTVDISIIDVKNPAGPMMWCPASDGSAAAASVADGVAEHRSGDASFLSFQTQRGDVDLTNVPPFGDGKVTVVTRRVNEFLTFA